MCLNNATKQPTCRAQVDRCFMGCHHSHLIPLYHHNLKSLQSCLCWLCASTSLRLLDASLEWVSAGYWSVDAKAETAMGGVWKKGPGAGLFKSLNDVSAVPWQASLQASRHL